MINSNYSNISFTSKIRFVSNSDFENITSNQSTDCGSPTYIGHPWDQVKTGKTGLTEDAYGCNAGGLTNTTSREVSLFHFKPASANNFETAVKEKINQGLSQMQAYTEKLGALIVGGKISGSGDLNYVSSEKLSKQLEDLFKTFHAEISKFCGQTTSEGHTNVFYSGHEDTWYVNYQANSYTEQAINTPEDLKAAYYNISVSDNDQVFIGEQPVEKFDLKHGFKRIPGGYELDLAPRNPFYQPQYDYGYSTRNNNQKVKLYLADYGKDRSTLWIDSSDPKLIAQVPAKLAEIKECPLFKNITQIQCASNEAVQGFESTKVKLDGKTVYEVKV